MPAANAEEKELSSSSLDEGTNRMKLLPPTTINAYKEGANLNDTNTHIMCIFSIPYDNIKTVENFIFNYSK